MGILLIIMTELNNDNLPSASKSPDLSLNKTQNESHGESNSRLLENSNNHNNTRGAAFGDYKSNERLQTQMKQYENSKKSAHEDAQKIKEEDDILKEKADTYNIIRNRVAYLRKKIEECNK